MVTERICGGDVARYGEFVELMWLGRHGLWR